MYVLGGRGSFWKCLYVYVTVFVKVKFNCDDRDLASNLDCKPKVHSVAKAIKCDRRSEGRCMRDIK